MEVAPAAVNPQATAARTFWTPGKTLLMPHASDQLFSYRLDCEHER
jgi:hypothetical protein